MSIRTLDKVLRSCIAGALAATLFGCATPDEVDEHRRSGDHGATDDDGRGANGKDRIHDGLRSLEGRVDEGAHRGEPSGGCTGGHEGDGSSGADESSSGAGEGSGGAGEGSSGAGEGTGGAGEGSGGAGGGGPEPIDGGKSCGTLPATRTQGFWQNHACVIDGAATGTALVPIKLGASAELGTTEDVVAYFEVPALGNSTVILGHQLLAAKLNVAAFSIGARPFHDWDGDGKLESVADLVAIADTLFDGDSDELRIAMSAVLDALNHSGDALELWFDPLCQKPAERCDGIDNDGDGQIDEACICVDGGNA